MEIYLIIIAIPLFMLAIVAILDLVWALGYVNGIEEQQPIKTPAKPPFKAKPKPTDDELKYEKILANIDAYDGSGKGQCKV